MKDWKKELDRVFSDKYLAEYKGQPYRVRGMMVAFIETLLQQERERVVEEIIVEIDGFRIEGDVLGLREYERDSVIVPILEHIKKKYLSKKGEGK